MISKLFVYFIIFSFMGWVYESIYCTLRKHHWENRGFLFGPICPIYGIGGVLGSLLCGGIVLDHMNNLEIFVSCYLGSIVLEYVTSFVLEKLFHAVWWDYSDQFMNIHGRVCLGASIGFGVAGIVVINYIYPFTVRMTSWMNQTVTEVFALLFMAVLGADLALTVSALTTLMQNIQAIEEKINNQMEEFYQGLESGYNGAKLSAAEKREELTANATETAARFLNIGQRHALHSVKEFRYGGTRKSLSDRIIAIERGIVEKAAAVKDSAVEKATVVKDTVVEKATDVKDSAVEKATVVKDTVMEKATDVKDTVVEKATDVKDSAVEKAGNLKESRQEKRRNRLEDKNED